MQWFGKLDLIIAAGIAAIIAVELLYLLVKNLAWKGTQYKYSIRLYATNKETMIGQQMIVQGYIQSLYQQQKLSGRPYSFMFQPGIELELSIEQDEC